MGPVRSCARYISRDDGLGNYVPMVNADAAKLEIVHFLLGQGLQPFEYTHGTVLDNPMGTEPEAISYRRGGEPFRREPVLIDDGGDVLGGLPVIKIAIRDASGANVTFRDSIVGILASMLMKTVRRGTNIQCVEGTEVYALKRVEDDHGGDELSVEVPNPASVASEVERGLRRTSLSSLLHRICRY